MRKIILFVLMIALAGQVLFARSQETFAVHFIDVGQADSTLVVDNGFTMLIDAGNNADGRLVAHYLKSMGIEHIDVLVGTHPHEDHIGGLDEVIESFSIGTLMMPAKTHNTRSFEDVLDTIAAHDLKITVPKVGHVFTLGDSHITVLAPVRTDYININDHSIVLMLERNGKRFLFEADAETSSEWHMIGTKANLAADVLKVAHHGSDTSTNSTFIKTVNPSVSVVHVGKNNPYGHPVYSVLKRIPGTIYRTDLDGTVIISLDTDNAVAVETAAQTSNPYWKPVLFIGDRSTMRYHLPDCKVLPTAADQVGLFGQEDAEALGYSPCVQCKP